MQKLVNKTEKRMIGVLGSAFNPPHNGHLDVIQQMDGLYERILLVPSFSHAFGKKMEDFDIRCKMTKALVNSNTFESDIQVLPIEKELVHQDQQSRPVYTWDLLSAIAAEYQTDSIDFILGPDNANPHQWQRFYRADDIAKRWGLAIADERVAVRSSLVRKYITEGKTIPHTWLQKTVLNLIKQHGLYVGESNATGIN